MKTQIIIALLALTLAACTPEFIPAPSATPVPTAASTAFPSTLTPTLEVTPVIITVTLTPTQLTVVPTLNPIQVVQEEEIKRVIQAYFEIRYQALSVEKPDGFRLDSFGDLVSVAPEAKAFLEAELDKLAVERKHAELNQLKYVKYEYFLDFEKFTLDASSQIAAVSVVEGSDVIFEISEQFNPANPIVSHTYNLKHTITLHKEQSQWKIVSDEYEDDLWRMLRQSGTSAKELLLTMQAPTKPAPTKTP